VITLYHCVSARSFRPLWLMEEMGMEQGKDYELRMLDFPPRALDRSYLDINPTGTIPYLIDGHTHMSESAAICQYIATRYGPTDLNVGPEEDSFGAYLNYLYFGEATLTFPQTLVLRYTHMETSERAQPQIAEDYSKWFLARLRTLEAQLQAHEYLCANRFTAADISVGYALLLATHLGLEGRFPHAITSYWHRLQARAGYTRALALQHDAAVAQGVSPKPTPDLRADDVAAALAAKKKS
jgi:glutathione S-transferase